MTKAGESMIQGTPEVLTFAKLHVVAGELAERLHVYVEAMEDVNDRDYPQRNTLPAQAKAHRKVAEGLDKDLKLLARFHELTGNKTRDASGAK
jgi:hypothetical protein